MDRLFCSVAILHKLCLGLIGWDDKFTDYGTPGFPLVTLPDGHWVGGQIGGQLV